jgi:predicted molibdopterin-dependent oxidoreductase YjgC
LHKDRFARGKGLFHAVDFIPPAEVPDAEYPYWLTTGTIFTHYLTGTMTRRCPTLNRENPEAIIEINPADARRLDILPGDWVRAGSRRGHIKARAIITDRIGRGVVFIPLHFVENAANKLTNAARDPITRTPEYKVCAVNLARVA